ncbi:MAG: hypothetical protein AAFQ40_07550 [Cyanobacteria bacterium J06623_5]
MLKLIRPLIGLALVVVTILIGFAEARQWVVLLLGVLFTVAYIDGKWTTVWQEHFQRWDRKFYQSLLATYVVETIIVLSLYWLGRGTAGLL